MPDQVRHDDYRTFYETIKVASYAISRKISAALSLIPPGYSSLCPQTCNEKREDYPEGISQEVTDSKGSVGDKGLMYFIGEPVQCAYKAENNIHTQGIIKGRVPWIGGKHEGEAEEEIGGGMEQEIIKGDQLKGKLYFLQGGDIEDSCRHKNGRQSVSGLSQYLATLKG
jgi:hypothetical protein